MLNRLLALVEEAGAKKDLTDFEIGDTVDVHQRILEGQKERVQIFSGVVIGRHGGGLRETFTVRRIVQGEGVERIFPLHSPKIAKIEVKRTGRVRRAKLYYLRDRVGKATRLRERKVKGNVEGAASQDGKANAQGSVAAGEQAGAQTST
jgi:large subunit ribosomal protein L19